MPDNPILPFIEGDGTGRDIWRASQAVFDAAVEKAYKGKKKIAWYEVLAGEKAFKQVNNWLPDETVDAFREYLVGIKGPLTTPVGGGIRSLNVALRQMLDLYVCLRPVRCFKGVPRPVKHPEKVDMVIFRENTEDIYAGIEFEAGTRRGGEVPRFLQKEFPKDSRRSASRTRRHRHQAGVAGGHRAAGPRRHRVRHRAQAQERHARAQGQHHEVHRGRLPRSGATSWPRASSVTGLHLGSVGANKAAGRGGRQRRAEGRGRREDPHQGLHRGHHAAAGAHPSRRVRRHRHAQPQRRLPLRRAGRAGGRHRHRAGRQHQLRHRPRASSRPPTAPRPSTRTRTR